MPAAEGLAGCLVVCAQVLYQDECMVELLVFCQAHNYLEFKLIEGRWACKLFAVCMVGMPMLSCASRLGMGLPC